MICGIVKSQNDEPLNLTHYDLKPYHFGLGLGLNKMYFHVDPSMNVVDSMRPNSTPGNIGFNLDVVANYRLNNFIDLRFIPELSFCSQPLIFMFSTMGFFLRNLTTLKPLK